MKEESIASDCSESKHSEKEEKVCPSGFSDLLEELDELD